MAKIVLFTGVDPLATGEYDYPWHPLSILAIGSMLQAVGHSPVLLDCQIHRDWREQIARNAPEAAYVGVSCMTGPGIGNALEAIEIARKAAPEVPIVWGGCHASLAYRGILREHLADVTVVGAGEYAAVALAGLAERTGALADRAALAEIDGIAYLDGRREFTSHGELTRQVCATKPAAPRDMDELPPADYTLLPVTSYYTETTRDLSYCSSYGCPHPSGYCTEPRTSGCRRMALNPARVASELAALWRTYTPHRISLLDPCFSTNTQRVAEIVEALEAQAVDGLRLRANMHTRDIVTLADEIDLARLREAGFTAVFVGCDSGSERMLKALGKGATVEDTRRACRLLSDAGVVQLTSWIHDLPGEEQHDSDQTFTLAEELAALPHNDQRHHFFTPFPATELHEAAFGPTDGDVRTQAQWAKSTTYGTDEVWSGRPEFRRRVRIRLEHLQRGHPAVLTTALPTP